MRLLITVALLTIACAHPQWVFSAPAQHTYQPAQGYVPDEATAIKIAEAVWLPIYGQEIYDKKPFSARLVNDIWIVSGTLPDGVRLGGVPEAEISKITGQILRVSHGK